MFYAILLEKRAEREEGERSGVGRELAGLGAGAALVGGGGLLHRFVDADYMGKRKRVLAPMHGGGALGVGEKTKENVRQARLLKNVRRLKAVGIGVGGLTAGVAAKSIYDKYKRNKERDATPPRRS